MHSPIFFGTTGNTNLSTAEIDELRISEETLEHYISECDYVDLINQSDYWDIEGIELPGKTVTNGKRTVWTITRETVKEYQDNYVKTISDYLENVKKIGETGKFAFGNLPFIYDKENSRKLYSSLIEFKDTVNPRGGIKIVIDGWPKQLKM